MDNVIINPTQENILLSLCPIFERTYFGNDSSPAVDGVVFLGLILITLCTGLGCFFFAYSNAFIKFRRVKNAFKPCKGEKLGQ